MVSSGVHSFGIPLPVCIAYSSNKLASLMTKEHVITLDSYQQFCSGFLFDQKNAHAPEYGDWVSKLNRSVGTIVHQL